MARFTIQNHHVHPLMDKSYRLPCRRFEGKLVSGKVNDSREFRYRVRKDIKLIRVEGGLSPCWFGEVIDRLGEYEDIGSPEDIKKRLALFGDNTSQKTNYSEK